MDGPGILDGQISSLMLDSQANCGHFLWSFGLFSEICFIMDNEDAD